jgi:hypothetical protein
MNLDSTPKALGFICSPSEHTMYARGHGRSRLVLGVYVDDLIMAGADTEETARFKKEMMEQFCMSDLGLMHYYLGIEVRQSGIGIVVMRRSCWSAQAWRPATLQQCPWSRGSSSARIASTHPRTPKFYRSMVGCLRYLVHTRSDISFAVGYASRFMEAPTTERLAAVKHLLKLHCWHMQPWLQIHSRWSL